MSPWLVGMLAGWTVLVLTGADRRLPWRVATLEAPRARWRAGPRRGARPARPGRSSPRSVASARADLVLAIDLLAVAVSAGHSLHGALRVVAEQPRGPVTRALAAADVAVGRGVTLEQALDHVVGQVGDLARPLVSTLQLSQASGSPLGPALERLGDAERRRNRRLAETRVRRLPVLLLGPVVGLVLPAFVVLTLVPVGLGPAMSGLAPLIGAAPPPPAELNRSTPWTPS